MNSNTTTATSDTYTILIPEYDITETHITTENSTENAILTSTDDVGLTGSTIYSSSSSASYRVV